ncbi:hypothetical protein EBN15_14340 [Xanthomonas cucurbitae]|nr:hypothetical protein EBN15_14340 [Xanthomonas cucurbitae]
MFRKDTTADYRAGASNSGVKIDVDADNLLGRQFSELEKKNLPFVVMQAVNATAYEIRETWKRSALRVFDRPTPTTRNAVLYAKATKDRLYAQIFLRNEALKGTAPDKYLQAQVLGGERGTKGFERLLQKKGLMPAGAFAVAGRRATLDQYGNVSSGQIRQILSQMQAGAEQGYVSNESNESREKRQRREARKFGRTYTYFVLKKRRGRLLPGLYERSNDRSRAIRSIFIFATRATYRPRYDIFAQAQRQWDKLMPFYFSRELEKALQSSMYRVRP